MGPEDRARLDALLDEYGLLAPPEPLRCVVLTSVDSTSTECARELARSGAERCMVLADAQTAGRGRGGHSFYSPAGAGLYLSVGCRRPAGPFDGAMLTTFAAVAAAEEIERLTGLRCGIKWVNDLLLAGKKVCGILTEAVGGHVIVGIGVNLTASAVPPELQGVMGWLGAEGQRLPLAAALTKRLLDFRPDDRSHLDEYRRRSTVLGRTVRFTLDGLAREGTAEAILDDGALAVRCGAKRVLLRCGEISLAKN